ncbi:MAG: T9SS type A sorting domain-containing protein [Segetibacter sp.]
MEPILLDSYGCLNVVASNIGKLTLKVFDTNGRVAKKICKDIITGVQKLDLNINDLSNGTYVLNAFQGDVFLKSFKFVKE